MLPAEPHPWNVGEGRLPSSDDHYHVASHQVRGLDGRLHQVDLDANCWMFTPGIPPHCRTQSPRLPGVNLQVGDPLMTPAGHASASVEHVGKRTQLQNVWRVRWGPQGLGSRDIEDVEVQGFHGREDFDQMPDLEVGAARWEVYRLQRDVAYQRPVVLRETINTKPHRPPEGGVSRTSNVVRPINSVDSEDKYVPVGVDMSTEAAGKLV